jgi:hypothetical protein
MNKLFIKLTLNNQIDRLWNISSSNKTLPSLPFRKAFMKATAVSTICGLLDIAPLNKDRQTENLIVIYQSNITNTCVEKSDIRDII